MTAAAEEGMTAVAEDRIAAAEDRVTAVAGDWIERGTERTFRSEI